MFQSFTESADPSQGPARLAQLRTQLEHDGLTGFLIPLFRSINPCAETN